MLPTNAQERKAIPVYSGFLCYFPLAVAEVAKHSLEGNEQHNPGEPLHWNRAESKDERDSQARHLLDQCAPSLSLDDEILHARAGAWRAMANLQKLCEQRDADRDTREGRSIFENSKSQKITEPITQVAKFGEFWTGKDAETIEQFRERTAPGSGKASTRQAPKSLL